MTTKALFDENLVDKVIAKKGEGFIAIECSSEFKRIVELTPENALGVQNFGILSQGEMRHGGGKCK
jgi:Holliday junction resolvase